MDCAFDYTRADAGYGSLDDLVARGAEHQRAARVDGREEGIAVFEPMLEVYERFVQLREEPVEFALLRARLGVC